MELKVAAKTNSWRSTHCPGMIRNEKSRNLTDELLPSTELFGFSYMSDLSFRVKVTLGMVELTGVSI